MNPQFLQDMSDIAMFHREAVRPVLDMNELLINKKTYTKEMIETQFAASGLVRMFSIFEAAVENTFGKRPRGEGLIDWLKKQNGVDSKGSYQDWETLEVLYKLRHCFGHTSNKILSNRKSSIQGYDANLYQHPARFKIVNQDEIELKISSLESLRMITVLLVLDASPHVSWN